MHATLSAEEGDQPVLADARRGGAALPLALGRPAFAIVFLLWWAVAGTWALATPIWGSPDEYQHAYRAYAAVRGEVVIRPEAAQSGTGGFVQGPRGWTASIEHLHCYAFHPTRTADCLPPLTNDATPQRVASTAARYNPVYYLIVGSASLITGPAHSVWAMRAVSAALSAVFLAWAFTSAATARRPGLATSALLLASTPMVGFLAAAINPNGLEITAAMSAWVNGFLMLSTGDEVLRRCYLRRTAISAMAVLVTRGLSPVWVVIIALILPIAVGRRQNLSRLWSAGRGWWLVVLATAITSAAWTVLDKTLVLNVRAHMHAYTFSQRWDLAWGNHDKHLFLWRGTIGTFGWLDTSMPMGTEQFCTVVAALLVLLALALSRWRAWLAMVLLAAASLLLPTYLEARNWNVSGPVWQPRYTMPISLGLVILAGLLLSQSRRWPAWRPAQLVVALALCATAGWTNLCGFVIALSRYVVGTGRPISLSGAWHPPVPGMLLLAVQALAWLLLSALAVVLSVERGTAHRPPHRDSAEHPAPV